MRNKNITQKKKTTTSETSHNKVKRSTITFVISLIVIIIGCMQFFGTFHTYLNNEKQLHTLEAQQSSLESQKTQLDQQINKWSDKDYIIDQAREQLGFTFPDETYVELQDIPANEQAQNPDNTTPTKPTPTPWYKQLLSAIHNLGKIN
ncbi:MAG: septum formation initiator family protein [Aeriscardovia sp.]|nr:septum formation initiator family protein [Aeriscardovia sp.]MBO5633529.1 septum formation initiator family protein [Aeriscardovia sp.]